MRLGIFGGSFNPVHYGHLLLAECCREQRALDQVWFLPTAIPPHKRQQEPAPGVQRLEMLELAIGGHEAFGVSSYEVDRGGVNYTVDTLAHLKEEDPSRELFFLMGADSLADLPNWREPERICSLATPLVVRRSADAEPDFGSLAGIVSPGRIVEIRSQQVEMPRVDLSASDLRGRVAVGQSIRFRTPRAVEKYIETHGLYRAAERT
jgi:nicotinate-nucleotide adenylyltransferase